MGPEAGGTDVTVSAAWLPTPTLIEPTADLLGGGARSGARGRLGLGWPRRWGRVRPRR